MNLENINLNLLNKYSHIKEYKNGDIIFNEGESCINIGIVLEGEAKIVTYTYNFKEETINLLNKGSLFGQFIIFSSENKYFGTCIALRKTKIMFLSKVNLLKIFKEDEEILNAYLKEICDQGIKLKQKNKLLSHKNIRDRIMFYIKSNNKNGLCEIKSITTLSDELNLPRPSLSRELIKMQNEGIIKYNKHYIEYKKKTAE